MKSLKCVFGFHNYYPYSFQNGICSDDIDREYYHFINNICAKCGKIKTYQGRGHFNQELFSKVYNIQKSPVEVDLLFIKIIPKQSAHF